jgi:hypothetical protein
MRERSPQMQYNALAMATLVPQWPLRLWHIFSFNHTFAIIHTIPIGLHAIASYSRVATHR